MAARYGRRGRFSSCPRAFQGIKNRPSLSYLLNAVRRRETAFEWPERSVSTGFASWPYCLKDPSLASLRILPEFELLITALQAKYPDHLGLL
jgi:hypothetical protein